MVSPTVEQLITRTCTDKCCAGVQTIEDPGTGVVFEGESGARPELDRRGQLAWRALSYQQWPVEAGAEGDRVRVQVGPVNALEPRTYVFTRCVHAAALSCPRPLINNASSMQKTIHRARCKGGRFVHALQ